MTALRDLMLVALADGGEHGLREDQLAAAVCASPEIAPRRVSATCEMLMANGEIERRGEGTNEIPYTYHLPEGRVPRL
ncbi:hypothetical protein DWF00_28365 [Bosea caraganae]|uniref:MarR family transcriptional regulator n=1 Tax=Bosea caraganae TaxID=2763117 RepID=A0A370L306_9HYPH|nr:hypothetical protein DWF00_28365 [Bosea caraganae]RDJ22608.1 hypothetical protein DWE98_19460 [Bosea caraganae]